MVASQWDLWLISLNNSNINHHLMGGALDGLELKEISLSGRRFTWSNEKQNPTLIKNNCCFCSNAWDVLFPSSHLQPCQSSRPTIVLSSFEVWLTIITRVLSAMNHSDRPCPSSWMWSLLLGGSTSTRLTSCEGFMHGEDSQKLPREEQ